MKRLLEIKNVSAGYVVDKKTNVVVADACLSLCGGQLVSMLGANGAGKSTLLRTIAGTQRPLQGDVLVDGKSLKSMSRKELAKMVSVVSTDRTQAGGLTVEELVGLGRQPHTGFLGRLDSSDREIVAEAMEAVGISHKAEKFVAELSDGERQKAMIARAVAQQTPVILLDERFSTWRAVSMCCSCFTAWLTMRARRYCCRRTTSRCRCRSATVCGCFCLVA